ncbi:MAG: RNA-binding S4 domain-containing protein [Actinomycetaceae bacterium]|nr:RNA-binding S4 domain-containing protein [Actinomycetaceae bacterium]
METKTVRVDTWVWAVRLVKSRSRATAACRAGRIKVNGNTVKAAYALKVGDQVSYRVDGFDRVVEVTRLIYTRVGAPVAQTCYLDHSPPRPPRLAMAALPVRERGSGRPTKRERRQLDELRGRDTNAQRRRG